MKFFLPLLVSLSFFYDSDPIDYFLDTSQERVYVLYKNKIAIYNLKYPEKIDTLIKIKYDPAILLDEFRFVSKNKLTSTIGGKVLELKNDSIYRIDTSFDHRMQFGAIEFIRKDTIYRYGGYGFFETRNFFTYYDYPTKGWESLDINGTIIPERLGDCQYFIYDDYLYITGGYRSDKFKKTIRYENKKTYVFNFNTKEWRELGYSDYHTLTPEYSLVFDDKVLGFFKNSVCELKFNTNTFTIYEESSWSRTIQRNSLDPFNYKDHIYYFNKENNTMRLSKVALTDFLSSLKITKQGTLYKRNHMQLILYILLTASLLVIINLMIKNYNKLRRIGNSYFFNFNLVCIIISASRFFCLLF